MSGHEESRTVAASDLRKGDRLRVHVGASTQDVVVGDVVDNGDGSFSVTTHALDLAPSLAEALLARIAEDDRRAVLPSFMHTHGTHWSNRVLAECEIKRRIVARHKPREMRGGGEVCLGCGDDWPCADLRDLASIYEPRT